MSERKRRCIVEVLSYSNESVSTEGIFTPILPGLLSVSGATEVSLTEDPKGERDELIFRSEGEVVLNLALVRHSGGWVAELSGKSRDMVRAAVQLCRDHFDRWFGADADGDAGTQGKPSSSG